MDLKTLREKDWIIYDCIRGSQAYGLATPTSDIDIGGVYVQPTSDILKGAFIPQIQDKKGDTVFYEIGRFIELICKGNPNMLDLLATPKECIIYEDKCWKEYFPDSSVYLTKNLRNSFVGYASSQIKKAKGLNKKINWDKASMTRKDVLDFCYVLGHKEESIMFKDWKYAFEHTDIGLAKVNNFPDIYSMYYLTSGGGIISEDSNEVQTRNIPKLSKHLGYLRFDRNAYSQHCKAYAEYTKWIKERNPVRYKENTGQGFDRKNMLHCMRLLYTAKDIAKGKLQIQRPERDYLLSIRNGKVNYNNLLQDSEKLIQEIKEAFDNSNLPDNVSLEFKQNLLLKIRNDKTT